MSYIKYISEKRIPGFQGICYQCDFCTSIYSDSNVRFLLGEDLHKSLAQAAAKRKSEFVAGRYLARQALTALGAHKPTVGVGANRAPLWPDSFVGSISHSKEFAICAVAKQNDIKSIGIDIESILEVKAARNIMSIVLIESEYKLVGTYANPNPVSLTLVFSAKESLFKVLYPEAGRFFGFNAAEMKEIDFEAGKFTLELVQELTPILTIGTRFEGQFELNKNQVFTVITC